MQLTEISFVMREMRLTLSLVLRVKIKITYKTDRGVGAFRTLGEVPFSQINHLSHAIYKNIKQRVYT